jgi:ATP-dependent DNA ligase
VVAGLRWHKEGKGIVGSLLLGLYDDHGVLQHVGVTSASRWRGAATLPPSWSRCGRTRWRGTLARLGRSRRRDLAHARGQSRWSAGKNLEWEALRIERVCEVKYDHLQGDRFRHAAIFLRWRPDKAPRRLRYDQLEVTNALRARKGLRWEVRR